MTFLEVMGVPAFRPTAVFRRLSEAFNEPRKGDTREENRCIVLNSFVDEETENCSSNKVFPTSPSALFPEGCCPSSTLGGEMHRPGPVSSELGFLPSLYPIPGLSHTMDVGMSKGAVDSGPLAEATVQNPSWERRYLRKQKRRFDDEGCEAKRSRLMGEELYMPWGDPRLDSLQATQPSSSPLLISPIPQPAYPSAIPSPPSCLEMEAAQRRLQEIEDRITLEDDEEEDLDMEPAQNRPVLVLSDSLREGLQQGLGDILPQAVAQSMSRSCMELVLWRPPEEALPQKLKDSLQRQRKQMSSRQPPSAPTLASKSVENEVPAALYCSPGTQVQAEEEMEL